MTKTTIADIRATPVTVPLEAPLLHSNGAHWGRFVRTIVEVETSDGYVGLGEMGGGGEDATRAFAGLLGYLRGHDVFALEAMRFAICNPTASLYNNRTQLHAALEFACLDIMGQKLGVPVHALLGGKVRDAVDFASYLFFRYANPETGEGEVRTRRAARRQRGRTEGEARIHVAQAERRRVSAHARARLLSRARAVAARRALSLRPQLRAVAVADAIAFGQRHPRHPQRLLRGPRVGHAADEAAEGIRAAADRRPTRSSINFEQLAENVRNGAVDVILLDTTFWGGIRPCIKAAGVCETMGLGVAVHSSGELGIQLATMLHMGAVVPNLGYAADAHYHHLVDDVIAGRPDALRERRDPRARRPGLGVTLDRGEARAVSRAVPRARRISV